MSTILQRTIIMGCTGLFLAPATTLRLDASAIDAHLITPTAAKSAEPTRKP